MPTTMSGMDMQVTATPLMLNLVPSDRITSTAAIATSA